MPQLLFLYEEQERERLRAMLDLAEAVEKGAGGLFDGKHLSDWRRSLNRLLDSLP